MFTEAEREQMIGSVAGLPEQLEAFLSGLTEEQLDTPYREGGWTIRQVVHHLADSHMNAYIRTKLIVTEEHPTLKPYDQNAWSGLADTKLPVTSSLAILRGLHHRWVILLRDLSEGQWNRTAFHPEHGEMTAEMLLSSYVRHGETHLAQIRSLRDARGW
jgi:hypothetical protein